MDGLAAAGRLHARIFHTDGSHGASWYADIDDPEDQRPDDPFWYGYFPSQHAAVDAACQLLELLANQPPLPRISELASR